MSGACQRLLRRPQRGLSRFPSFYNWDLSVLREGGRCVSSRAAPRRAARGTPFFCFHAAFTEHEKKKNGPHHAEFLTPVPPASNAGVVAHLRDEPLLREGCFKAVLDVKSDGPGAQGTSGRSWHCESLLVAVCPAAINHTAAFQVL